MRRTIRRLAGRDKDHLALCGRRFPWKNCRGKALAQQFPLCFCMRGNGVCRVVGYGENAERLMTPTKSVVSHVIREPSRSLPLSA